MYPGGYHFQQAYSSLSPVFILLLGHAFIWLLLTETVRRRFNPPLQPHHLPAVVDEDPV